MVMMVAGTLQADRLNRYAVKSGKVSYDISGSSEIKAIGYKESIRGKKNVVFDAYGTTELVEVEKIIESSEAGKSDVEKKHELTYISGSDRYRINFDKKRIKKDKNPYYTANYTLVDGKDIKAFMPGAKRTGTEMVAGLECTTWKRKSETMCIYKGIVLKKHWDGVTTIARKVDFDVVLGDNDFKLPDFPLYDKRGKKLTLEQGDIAKQNKSDNASGVKVSQREVIAAGLKAAQKVGFKGDKLFSSKEKMTKDQEQAAALAMENLTYPGTKQEILKEEKAMYFAKKCFTKAKNISEASKCTSQISEMTGHPTYIMKWDERIKEKKLAMIDEFLNVRVPCAKSSDTGDAYGKCREENKE